VASGKEDPRTSSSTTSTNATISEVSIFGREIPKDLSRFRIHRSIEASWELRSLLFGIILIESSSSMEAAPKLMEISSAPSSSKDWVTLD
jgi:hypothetical protein